MMKRFTLTREPTKIYMWNFEDDDEEGRESIHDWSKGRQRKERGLRKWYHNLLVYTFSVGTLKSFLQNFNYMVVIQMVIAGLGIYFFQYHDISFDVHVGLFVSPIVFPLAFSINTDFQRREKVLEDLANFKSAGMLWYFCMREWKRATGLDDAWMNAVHSKLQSMLFHLREYLLTEKLDRRKIILRAMYEDFSDTSQLIEDVRTSKLPANTAIVSRSIHLLNMMSLSFEKLRVVREYRSPRSIRSFNKVLILFLPIILGPYFVEQAKKSNNEWSAYYIAILVSFVFSALQGVQDKLDDPFDGMSEDDIDLEQIDEWTFNSLEATVNRTCKIGRFQVNVDCAKMTKQSSSEKEGIVSRRKSTVANIFKRRSTRRKQSLRRGSSARQPSLENHPYKDVLGQLNGNTTITRCGVAADVSEPLITKKNSQCLGTFPNPINATQTTEKHPHDEPPLYLQSIFEMDPDKTAPPEKQHLLSLQSTIQKVPDKTVKVSRPSEEKSVFNASTSVLDETKIAPSSRFKLANIGRRLTSSTSLPSPNKIDESDEFDLEKEDEQGLL